MLQKLPNEILVKILEKTKSKTNQNCRLLNSRFDNIIKKFELHKKEVSSICICDKYERIYRYNCSIYVRMKESSKDLKTEYNSYSEMIADVTQLLQYKFRSISHLSLNSILIDDDIMQLFANVKCLRTLSSLSIYGCFFKCNSTDKWFFYLSQLRLDDFSVDTSTEDTLIPIPETILNNVANYFRYYNGILGIKKNEFDLPWMNDLVLEKWFSPEKWFYIHQVKTAFTLEAVMRCIKMLPLKRHDDCFDFGLLANVTSAKCERLLSDSFGPGWRSYTFASNVKYFNYDPHDYNSFRIAFGVSL